MLLKFDKLVPVRSASGEIIGSEVVPTVCRIIGRHYGIKVGCSPEEGWRPVAAPARREADKHRNAGNPARC